MSVGDQIIIVTGSRNHSDPSAIHRALAEHSPSQVWSGGARGADTYAKQWASLTRCAYREFPARWSELGKRAGCVRNAEMMRRAPATAIVLAFPRGPLDGSKGTAHAVECARREGLKVKVLNQW